MVTVNEYRLSLWGDENVEFVLIVEQLCEYTENTEMHTLKG